MTHWRMNYGPRIAERFAPKHACIIANWRLVGPQILLEINFLCSFPSLFLVRFTYHCEVEHAFNEITKFLIARVNLEHASRNTKLGMLLSGKSNLGKNNPELRPFGDDFPY